MLIDPFSLKSKSKLSPERLAFTAQARAQDFWSRQNFERFRLPELLIPEAPRPDGDVDWGDTSVTPEQMAHLLAALKATPTSAACAVEVGCFRGVTTRRLAQATELRLVAVDPFIGHGSVESDRAAFHGRIADLDNVVHIRATSGAAAKGWAQGPVGFVFLDAVHDYANTSFDISVWWPLLLKGGFLAFHDTDARMFAGTRRAVYELYKTGAPLFAHVENLTILQKPA